MVSSLRFPNGFFLEVSLLKDAETELRKIEPELSRADADWAELMQETFFEVSELELSWGWRMLKLSWNWAEEHWNGG